MHSHHRFYFHLKWERLNLYFTEAALDIFNCQDVLFNHTVIEHNNGTGIDTTVSYRGNSGGVAFGYNMPENTIKLSGRSLQSYSH
jgi:hypothetical protein